MIATCDIVLPTSSRLLSEIVIYTKLQTGGCSIIEYLDRRLKSDLEKINVIALECLQWFQALPLLAVLLLLFVVSAGPIFIIVWKDDIDEKGGIDGRKLMQVILLGPSAINVAQGLFLQDLHLFAVELVLAFGVNFSLHFALHHKVDD